MQKILRFFFGNLQFFFTPLHMLLKILALACYYVDVALERTHNALIAGVENFQPSSLKRTDTKEKIVLPNAEGNFSASKPTSNYPIIN